MIGQRVGHYRILEKLGAGGMGEVYRAHDEQLDRDVAVKVLPASDTGDPTARERLLREARAAAALNHAHICTVHEVGECNGQAYIAMELVEGEPLSARLQGGPLSAESVVRLGLQLAAALAHAHARGILHRDLKSANIILTADGQAKMLDFGLAKRLSENEVEDLTRSQVSLTAPGALLGTPAYMAPEYLSGQSSDTRCDIWALGVVLYEMACGTRPFQGQSRFTLCSAILHQHLPPIPPAVPARLRVVIERCLAKVPAERCASADELYAALEGIERLGLPAHGRLQITRRQLRSATAAALVLLIAGALVVWTFARRARSASEHKAAAEQVSRLVDAGQFVEVWRVAGAALQRWPQDPEFERAIRATTNPINIATDPAGASVAFKAYDNLNSDWIPLGTTPLKEVRAPVGQLRWRITKSGFEPIEARLEVGAPAAAAGRPDTEAPPIRLQPTGSEMASMVSVPGGRQNGVTLTDYWIDRTEVTNREYKKFVDRGGYQDPRYWTELERAPRVSNRGGAGSTFTDRTGRPGPSTWELGAYPEGKDDFPVSGVSWYEAVAYCESVGKRLPSAFHWKKAFGASFFVEVLLLGNFNGRGPEDTRKLKEVGPYGTYGMAGNVKEWTWNQSGDLRYILGGAWNDPVYMATSEDLRPPLDRAETYGFRCIRESAASEAPAYAAYVSETQLTRDFTKEKPVGAAEFEIFRRFYSYDRTPLDPRIERTEELENWRRERVTFNAAYGGERVLANILIPKNSVPPYQAVIWFPGSYALGLSSSAGDLVFSYYFDFLPRSGRALVYPVYKGTYERRIPGELEGKRWRDLVIQWSRDLGRTVDYLESRSDIDSGKLAYYGFSMGASDALPAVALEPRLKTAILLTGGLLTSPCPQEIDPLNFVPRMRLPVLLLGGQYDFYFPNETSQKPLIRLLATPPENKKHVVFEGAGHVPPRIDVIREVLDWLDRYLGPVRQTRP